MLDPSQPIPVFGRTDVVLQNYDVIKPIQQAMFLEHVGFETMEVDSIPRYVYVRNDLELLRMASDLMTSALALLGG